MRARNALVGLGVAAVAALAVGLELGAGIGSAVAETTGTGESVATAEVVKRDLVVHEDADGTLGFGDERQLSGAAQGTVTWLPEPGAIVRRGGRLYEVDERPVRLLYGSVPMWRQLGRGVSDGTDVAQLERNLVALGHDPSRMTVDDHFDADTAAAVEDWQDELGEKTTGVLSPEQLAFLPGPRRIGQLAAAVGGQGGPGQAIMQTTATTPVVTVDLDTQERDIARVGARVSVEFPSGRVARGTIDAVGKVAEAQTDAQGGVSSPTVPVTIRLARPDDRDNLEGAPVTVSLESSRATGVLAVPVEALLALRGSGEAIEVMAADGSTSLVAVDVGTFADGYVEVSGNGVRKGLEVVVPS